VELVLVHHIALYNQIPSFHHLPYCPEYILMLGILQSVHHIPEHPCHTIGIIGVILVMIGFASLTALVYAGFTCLLQTSCPPDRQQGSAKASGIFKSNTISFVPQIFLTSSTNAGIWMVYSQS